jgi:hypothetical protein
VFGHLESGTDALMREFPKVLTRFREGVTRAWPLPPPGDLRFHGERAPRALQSGSSAGGNSYGCSRLHTFSESAPITNTGQHSATMIDRNWGMKICAPKILRAGQTLAPASLCLSPGESFLTNPPSSLSLSERGASTAKRNANPDETKRRTNAQQSTPSLSRKRPPIRLHHRGSVFFE